MHFCPYSNYGTEDTQGIFGVDFKHYSTDDVPEVLRACADAVQTRGTRFVSLYIEIIQDGPMHGDHSINILFSGIHSEGIYRVSGTKADIERLKRAFCYGYPNLHDLHDWDDINVIAGVLKVFLRELPSPLLTYELYEEFLNISNEGMACEFHPHYVVHDEWNRI